MFGFFQVIDSTFERSEGVSGLVPRLEAICAEAAKAINAGFSLLVLSDRNVSPNRIPIRLVGNPPPWY